MKQLSYENFNRGVLVISELKNGVLQIDWDKRVFSISSERISFPDSKLGKKLLRKYKVDLSGLKTYKLRKKK